MKEGSLSWRIFNLIQPTAIDTMILAMSKRGIPARSTIGIVLATRKLKALVERCREGKQKGQQGDLQASTYDVL
jgi:hypothetical protein